jgi:Putative peptidoglycan binding domain/Penicillin-insensitive murein endopeptidase
VVENWKSPISYSVGVGGNNRRDDVQAVQDLLNDRGGASLNPDGICGPATVAAIRKYQSTFMGRPDGRVEPNGATIRRLSGGGSASAPGGSAAGAPAGGSPASAPAVSASSRFEQLPQSNARGYYSYSTPAKQYGTSKLVGVLKDVGVALASEQLEMGVGDLSLSEGGDLPPHKTHRDGNHVDLRPIRSDRKRLPVAISDPIYDAKPTLRLVELLAARSEVRSILFNDSTMKGVGGKVQPWAGHDNHLHVRMQ